MPENKPLSHLDSTLTLNSYQQEEFRRISDLYVKVYNLLLGKWYRFAASKNDNNVIDGADMRCIDRTLRSMCNHGWLTSEEDQQVATFASNELCRCLREREYHGLPPPHPQHDPIERETNEVVFYWGYDIKVKDHTVRVPVLGKASTGRFRYFSGSIKAIGVRDDKANGMRCIIYYRENDRDSAKSATPAKPWSVGVDPIPKSPLNQQLRDAGIGFMV